LSPPVGKNVAARARRTGHALEVNGDMRRVGVDLEGTFTDVCLIDSTTGAGRVWKVPSTPDDPSRAIAHGVVEGLRQAAKVTPAAVDYFGHGTTVATNALIQHRGADTGLITTEGFRDLLEIGRQRRPHRYDLQADKPPVLVPRARRHEVRERLRHDGRNDREGVAHDAWSISSPGVPPPVRGQGLLDPAQSVAIITPGAGGYGDPRERDRALVRRDLAEGTISPAVARDAYGLTDRP